MSRFYQREGGYLLLGGDTFPIKDDIKSVGARWDGQSRQWKVREAPDVLVALEGLGFFARESASGVPATESLSALQPSTRDTRPAVSFAPLSPSDAPKIWSVGAFVSLVERLIAHHLGDAFWIVGEITSLRASNSHCYFDLAEREGEPGEASGSAKDGMREGRLGRAQSVACVLWAGRRKNIERQHGLGSGELPLADGVGVKLLVHAEFRKEQARIQLVVDDLDPAFTLGGLALARQALVKELKKRGLYDLNKRTTLAPFPLRVALMTADGSRAHTDFVDELKQSGFAFRVTLFDCHMQGEKTSADITEALAHAVQRAADFDCVVMTRGGGSRLDLRWFDDLAIAKAIAHCPLPVITAIGHFDDVSVADEVSHTAEKTPTGAAGFLTEQTARTFERCRETLARAASVVNRRVRAAREVCDHGEASLVQAAKRRIGLEQARLENYGQTLRIVRSHSARPLARGFALATREDGHVLTAADFMDSAAGAGANPSINEVWLALFDAKTSTDVRVHARVLAVRTRVALDAGDAAFRSQSSLADSDASERNAP